MTEEIRITAVNRLSEILKTLCENKILVIDQEYIPNISLCIEMSCYNKTITYATNKNIVRKWNNPDLINIYNREVIRIISYLDISNVDTIGMPNRDNVISVAHLMSSIDLNEIANMQHKDFLPKQTADIENIIKLRMQQKIDIKSCELDTPCSKCGHKKFQLYEVQTRSLDEGATLRATCINCGLSINIG